jgi:2-polyprenyl-6-methoxyphenol hydroxylase-like FAD-dependent oxidoreductase
VTKPPIPISGAGIAGPSLAYWLTRTGYHVVLVEIHDGIRPAAKPSTCVAPVGRSSSGWGCWIRCAPAA